MDGSIPNDPHVDPYRAGRAELADFLRARRARLDPVALGCAPRRRRTPGLRREEVAELAGIGVDWYTRLEQGRDVRPSITTIDALARALRLDEAERAHLHRLAHTGRRVPFAPEAVPAALARLVRTIGLPAYVTGQRWDLLAWNEAAVALFGDFGRMEPDERNILVHMLTDPGARAMFGETWEGEARRMIAQFRADFGVWAGDPSFEALVRTLGARSPFFAQWWESHEIRPPASGRKRLRHPVLGTVVTEYTTLQSNDDRRLKLVVYLPD